MTTAPLADVLDLQRDAERARALRALLRHPLLTPAGPDAAAFALVRKHADWLRHWFMDHAGWSLHVDAGLARLRKVPGDLADGTRAALADGKIPFSRRRYALICLALAALERADAQITLGRLADRVLSLTGDPALAEAGFAFALETQDARRDLVVVARLLLRLHVLTKVAGDEQSYVSNSGDALYDIDRQVLATLLVVGRGPSMVRTSDFEERLRAITEEPVADTEEGRAIRQRLSRRLRAPRSTGGVVGCRRCLSGRVFAGAEVTLVARTISGCSVLVAARRDHQLLAPALRRVIIRFTHPYQPA